MTLAVPNRRQLLVGLGAIIAAPAVVRASSLMKIKSWADWRYQEWAYLTDSNAWFLNTNTEPSPHLIALMAHMRWTQEMIAVNVFNDLPALTGVDRDGFQRRAIVPPGYTLYGSKGS